MNEKKIQTFFEYFKQQSMNRMKKIVFLKKKRFECFKNINTNKSQIENIHDIQTKK